MSLRNDEMQQFWVAGETLDQIGEKYKLTRERVRQILTKQMGKHDFDEVKKANQTSRKASMKELRLCQGKGCINDMYVYKTSKRKYCSMKCVEKPITNPLKTSNPTQYMRERMDKYRNTEKGKKAMKAAYDREKRVHPDRVRIRYLFNEGFKAGLVKKPKLCTVCGEKGTRIEAHHNDWVDPFNITWMCSRCNKKAHREAKEITPPVALLPPVRISGVRPDEQILPIHVIEDLIRERQITRDKLKEKYKACTVCGATSNLTIEHIVPMSILKMFGIHRLQSTKYYEHSRNLTVTCNRCNQARGNRIDLDDPKVKKVLMWYLKNYPQKELGTQEQV